MHKPYTYFSQGKFDEICALLAEGRNLREISRMENMPTASHIIEWSEKSSELRAQYTRARDNGYDLMADDIVDIADHDTTEQAKQRIEARKWLLSKCLPKKYGDKQTVEGKFNVDWAQVTQEAMDKWRKEEGGLRADRAATIA
jgi:hypothetical protein